MKKRIKSQYRWSLYFLVALLCACTDIDIKDNPNAATPDKADINDLFTNIQLDFNDVFNAVNKKPGEAVRMYHAGGNFTYEAWANPADLNQLWSKAYSDLLIDVETLIPLAEAVGLDIHIGAAKIMKAYTLMALVDIFGNVPNTEAGEGTDIVSPISNSGAAVYQEAIRELNEAIAQMDGSNAPSPDYDNYYNGDINKWTTLAKTLLLRAAVNLRLIGEGPDIKALIAEGDLIDEASEDFQFNYGNQRDNPNSRHWMYNSHYESGDGDYLSNYYMWILRASKKDDEGNPIRDPRLLYYFYRKVDDALGQDPTIYACHFSTLPDQSSKPVHYPEELPYCFGSEYGHIGRDHLNGEEISADGHIRTSYGLYPGGGQFDFDQFLDTRQSGTMGGLGQGISPIMLSSFTDFLRAEAALTMGTGEDARALLEGGIRKSMDKVESFESLIPNTMNTLFFVRGAPSPVSVKYLYGMSEEDVDSYVNFVLDSYDQASDKLDIVMSEYYIALWGNGLEAYNLYRRTGKPANMAPALIAEPGPFPASFFLPSDHVNRNATATQKEDLRERVFWDNGSAEVY